MSAVNLTHSELEKLADRSCRIAERAEPIIRAFVDPEITRRMKAPTPTHEEER